MLDDLVQMRSEMDNEVRKNILPFWLNKVMDRHNKTFTGEVLFNGTTIPEAPKSGILMARLVWTFSHAYMVYGKVEYLEAASLAYVWLTEKFWDADYGGIYWAVDWQGNPVDDKKHVYANSFALYALVEYFRATGDTEALEKAIRIFHFFEEHAHDAVHQGWYESFDRQWRLIEDARLAPGEYNAPKSMNTHLHLMEALTNLLRVWEDDLLRKRQYEMLRVFLDHIIDPQTNHFRLFLSNDWEPFGDVISYGHDIEGSWLLVEAAGVLGDKALQAEVGERALKMAGAVFAEGVDEDGAVFYEATLSGNLNTEKDWWPQAEAVVGFLNAFEMTKKQEYRQAAIKAWNWIRGNLVNGVSGEWYWGTDRSGKPVERELAGFWKCPYHNSRMCFEVMERVHA